MQNGAPVGPGGQHLPGGQRQLVWCLRVFARAPSVILLDEPTASMDGPSKAVLFRLIQYSVRQGQPWTHSRDHGWHWGNGGGGVPRQGNAAHVFGAIGNMNV